MQLLVLGVGGIIFFLVDMFVTLIILIFQQRSFARSLKELIEVQQEFEQRLLKLEGQLSALAQQAREARLV